MVEKNTTHSFFSTLTRIRGFPKIGGVCPEGVSDKGGVHLSHVDRITYTCENNLSATTVADGKNKDYKLQITSHSFRLNSIYVINLQLPIPVADLRGALPVYAPKIFSIS